VTTLPSSPDDVSEKLLRASGRPGGEGRHAVWRCLKQALASAAKIAQERNRKTIEPLHAGSDCGGTRRRIGATAARARRHAPDSGEGAQKPKPLRVTIAHTERRGGTSNVTFASDLRFVFAALVGVGILLAVSVSGAFAQVATDAPTKQEIASAYRSKSAEGGTAISGSSKFEAGRCASSGSLRGGTLAS
jgi:hypothetical protein